MSSIDQAAEPVSPEMPQEAEDFFFSHGEAGEAWHTLDGPGLAAALAAVLALALLTGIT